MTEKFFKSLEYELKQINTIFFSYAWREKTDEWLKTESRFTALIRWLDSEISERKKLTAIFNPADEPEQFNFYYKQLSELAFMLQARDVILDSHCTTSIRTAWEQKICEQFDIYYSDYLNEYL